MMTNMMVIRVRILVALRYQTFGDDEGHCRHGEFLRGGTEKGCQGQHKNDSVVVGIIYRITLIIILH